VRDFFNTYGVKRYSVIADHTSVAEDLPDLRGFDLCGFFTFDINLVGTKLAGHEVQLIKSCGPVPSCDGWLILSTLRAAVFALNHALMLTGNERQIVCRLYGGQTTSISTYMDFFSGETETLVQISNYFDRKYRTLFPVDLRYTIRECDGTVRVAGQRIIPAGGLTVIDSREINLGQFEGYMRVMVEVENLQSRVQPFMHY
jgi:hypothetical protein